MNANLKTVIGELEGTISFQSVTIANLEGYNATLKSNQINNSNLVKHLNNLKNSFFISDRKDAVELYNATSLLLGYFEEERDYDLLFKELDEIDIDELVKLK